MQIKEKVMSLENVKAFYKRLTSDKAFRTQIELAANKSKCSQIVSAAGYNFTQEEFEEFTSELIEADVSNNQFQELNEQELEAVMGGVTSVLGSWQRSQPKYGSVGLF
jgi:predicted ribosomally synthesized peptide with nif11-like leader